MIKAREIKAIVRAGGEQALIRLLEQAYERIGVLEKQVQEAAVIQLQVIKALDNTVTGAGAMRAKIQELQAAHRGDDDPDLPPAA